MNTKTKHLINFMREQGLNNRFLEAYELLILSSVIHSAEINLSCNTIHQAFV